VSGVVVRAVKLSDSRSVTARARSCWGSGAGTNSSGGMRSGEETAEEEEERGEVVGERFGGGGYCAS
jgi:hypothetical protein